MFAMNCSQFTNKFMYARDARAQIRPLPRFFRLPNFVLLRAFIAGWMPLYLECLSIFQLQKHFTFWSFFCDFDGYRILIPEKPKCTDNQFLKMIHTKQVYIQFPNLILNSDHCGPYTSSRCLVGHICLPVF